MVVELNELTPTLIEPFILVVAPPVATWPPKTTLPLIVHPEEVKPPSVNTAILAIGKPVRLTPLLSFQVMKVDGVVVLLQRFVG